MQTFLLLVLLAGLCHGYPYAEEGDYVYDNVENEHEENPADHEEKTTPKFVTVAEHKLVNEGDTVRLPCMVDRLGGFVMMWKKGGEFLTVNKQIISQRVRLDTESNGNYLILSQVTPEEEGDYTCQISAFKPTEITHTLQVRTKPELVVDPVELTVLEGSPALLTCLAESGSPAPALAWVSPQGEQTEGGELSIEAVTRSMAGQYTCQADNGWAAEPVTKQVVLLVDYVPTIEMSESVIVTDLGEQQTLGCNVVAHPKVESVTWTRDGVEVDPEAADLVVGEAGGQFSLTLLAVTPDTTGIYTCTAENKHGSAEGSVVVTGDASQAEILTSEAGNLTGQYRLEWSVESKSDIEQFTVRVRQAGTEDWHEHQVSVSGDAVSAAVEGEEMTVDAVVRGAGGDNETEETGSSGGVFTGEILLTGLQAGTEYEATVASSNQFGLGPHGDIFTFTTMQEATTVAPEVIEEVEEEEPAAGTVEPVNQPSVLTAGAGLLHPAIFLLLVACTTAAL